MSDKKTFVLRLNAKTYEALEKWAADEFRSVNGQLEWIIDKSLKDAKRNSRELKNTDTIKDTES
ncbi:MAG: hypothetical protein RIR48_830 [Bacteroidota bacterium]|jgi:hypothetical protein